MRFTIEVGDKEKSRIEFYRNWYTGVMRTLVDGRKVAEQSALSLSTYFPFKRKQRYEFVVGKIETHEVVLEHEPISLTGFREEIYRVFVDGQLVHEKSGY